MVENNPMLNIVVTGDMVIDWNLVRTCQASDPVNKWKTSLHTHASWQRGGALLLSDLIAGIGKGPGFISHQKGFVNILGPNLEGDSK